MDEKLPCVGVASNNRDLLGVCRLSSSFSGGFGTSKSVGIAVRFGRLEFLKNCDGSKCKWQSLRLSCRNLVVYFFSRRSARRVFCTHFRDLDKK